MIVVFNEYGSDNHPIEFYDSGSSDKWLVKSFFAGCYEKDGENIESITYESKIGTLEIALKGEIQFNEDGDVLSCQLYKSPDATVNVNGQDAFIKGSTYECRYFVGSYGYFE